MKTWRANLVLILIFIFGLIIIGKLFFIQVLNRDFYRALALGQQNDFERVVPQRGRVFFKDGVNELATDYLSDFVFVSLPKIRDKEETALILSKALNLKEDFILEKFADVESPYQELKTDLSEQEVKKIKELNLPGVYLSQKTKRYYPHKNLASQVIGFLGGEGNGQYGIEGFYDEKLKGQGKEKGADLVLTLDFNIQFEAEKLLEEAKKNLDIEGGQIIVIEPNSGKILALANFPNFDPNQYDIWAEKENSERFQNGAIQKLFEPGSIFKPIVMAAGLEEGKITPFTTYVDRGFVKIGSYTIHNYDNAVWGRQTMTQVLEKSINTGAIFAERQIGHQVFLKYIKKFGIFKKTGIDLQGEVSSENLDLKKGYEIDFATASFGQGIEMTPVQLVRAISAIANGGRLMRPYLVEKIIEKGKEIEIQPEIQAESVISSKTASKLTAMLVSSVEKGYARRARIPGYYIAGKTGTSQIPFPSLGIQKSGYSNKTWQSFIGFAPAFDPKFLVLVKLDNPRARAAGASTTLVAHDLIKYILDYYQIPPDYK